MIKCLNCLVFCADFIDYGSEFQILGPLILNDLIPLLVVLKGVFESKIMTCCFGNKIVFHENRIEIVKCFINFQR